MEGYNSAYSGEQFDESVARSIDLSKSMVEVKKSLQDLIIHTAKSVLKFGADSSPDGVVPMFALGSEIQEMKVVGANGITTYVQRNASGTAYQLVIDASLVNSGTDAEEVKAIIQQWLHDHPEATTTVADGSITMAKLSADIKSAIANAGTVKSVDVSITEEEVDSTYINYEVSVALKDASGNKIAYSMDSIKIEGATSNIAGLMTATQVQNLSSAMNSIATLRTDLNWLNGKVQDIEEGGAGIPDAPSDSKLYGRINGEWQEITETTYTAKAKKYADEAEGASVAAQEAEDSAKYWSEDARQSKDEAKGFAENASSVLNSIEQTLEEVAGSGESEAIAGLAGKVEMQSQKVDELSQEVFGGDEVVTNHYFTVSASTTFENETAKYLNEDGSPIEQGTKVRVKLNFPNGIFKNDTMSMFVCNGGVASTNAVVIDKSSEYSQRLSTDKGIPVTNNIEYEITCSSSPIDRIKFYNASSNVLASGEVQIMVTIGEQTNSLKSRIELLEEKTDNLNIGIDDLSTETVTDIYISPNLFNPNTELDGKYINPGSGLPTSVNPELSSSDYIEVEAGQPYYLMLLNENKEVIDNKARFVGFYDENKNPLLNLLISVNTPIIGYVIPSGVKYVVLSVYHGSSSTRGIKYIYFYQGNEPQEFEEYGEKKYIKETIIPPIEESKLSKDVQRKLNSASVDYQEASMRIKGNLTDGATFKLPKNSIKNCKSLSFTGKINSWTNNTKLYLGFGEDKYSSGYIVVDSTNISRYYYTTSLQKTDNVAHGLTITNNIQVSIAVNWGQTTINIVSNGVMFTTTLKNDIGDNGDIFAKIENGSLTDCSFGFYSEAIKCDNWLFGDSYFSTGSVNRWTSYLKTNGFTNNLLNGYSGDKSVDSLIDVKHLLEIGKPKRIIWCLGMNDSDGKLDTPTTTPNGNWLHTTKELKALCEDKGIELILSTIPSVYGGYSEDTGQSASRYNKAKTDWVRASGLRYIDFAKAVGASDTTGLWYGTTAQDIINKTGNGMLSSDGVHPTDKGAKTLYAQALADVPELMNTKM